MYADSVTVSGLLLRSSACVTVTVTGAVPVSTLAVAPLRVKAGTPGSVYKLNCWLRVYACGGTAVMFTVTAPAVPSMGLAPGAKARV